MSRFDLGSLRSRDELTAAGKELAAQIKSDDVASLAAAVSFKIVLALFPALLAAVAIFAMVTDPDELTALLGNLPGNVTEIVRPQLEEFIRRAESGGIAVGGIAVGLWAASGAAATLNKSLSRANDLDDDRTLVTARASALAVTVALLVALLGISVLLVAGGTIEDNVLASLPLTDTARSGLDVVSTVARYLLAVVLLMILFAFIYWIGPDFERRPRWLLITPGAALAVVTWLLASAVFGWYVANFGGYGEGSIYGSLGSAIVFMLWLQLSMFALLLGAEVNQVLRLRARRRASATVAVDTEREEARGSARTAAAQSGATRRISGAGLRPEAGQSPGRAVAVLEHADATAAGEPQDAGSSPGAPHRVSADVRQVPTETFVAAGIAAVSSLVGLMGLLRRLKAD